MSSSPPNKILVRECVAEILRQHGISDKDKLESIPERIADYFGLLLAEQMTHYASRVMTSHLLEYSYYGRDQIKPPVGKPQTPSSTPNIEGTGASEENRGSSEIGGAIPAPDSGSGP